MFSACITHLDDISSWKCSILGDPGAVSRVGGKGGTKAFKYGRKSPWVPTLIELFPKNSSWCRLLIGYKKCFVLLCEIGEQFLLSSFREGKLGTLVLRLWKNLSWDFEFFYNFRKNAVLNICRYLKGFYTHKKINNIFLKFHYYLLWMPKIIESGWIVHSEKRKSKA